ITGIKEFPNSPLAASGATDECQAWVKVSNSPPGDAERAGDRPRRHLAGPEGVGRQHRVRQDHRPPEQATFTLSFRWTLITWTGADNIPVSDAIGGTGANDPGNDISDQVTAVYGWDAAA